MNSIELELCEELGMDELYRDLEEQYKKDKAYSDEMTQKFKRIFASMSYEGRYVILDNKEIQLGFGIDVILQKTPGKEEFLEFKCVRKVADYLYIETDSCTIKGNEKDGWIKTSKADMLLYCMEDKERDRIKCHYIDFKKLQKYFLETVDNYNDCTNPKNNHTKCSIMPLEVVKKNIGYEYFEVDGQGGCINV